MKKTEMPEKRTFINVIVRWPERKKMDRDELLKRRLLEYEEEFSTEDEAIEYSYDEAVIDLENIMNFNRYTEDLTVVRTYQQEAYMVKIPFSKFQKIYTDITGNVIHEMRDDDDFMLK